MKFIHDPVFWAASTLLFAIAVGIVRSIVRTERRQGGIEAKVDQLLAEFPKNGIPARAVLDEVRYMAVQTKTAFEAHLKSYHGEH